MNEFISYFIIQCLLISFTDIFTGADELQASVSFSSVNKDPEEYNLLYVIKRLELLESSNNDLRNDNRKLRADVTSLKDHITYLQAKSQEQVTDLQTAVTDLETKNRQNEIKIQSLLPQVRPSNMRSPLEALKNENKNLTNDVAPLKGEKQTKQKRDRLFGTVEKVEERPESPEQGRRIRREENEINVAFYATVGQHHVAHIGVNQSIVFDDVITNLGNAYNKFAGDFRAPVHGTYVFSVTLMAYGDHTTHYRITQNGEGRGNIYLRGQDGAYTTSALTAILELKQGDNVTIQNVDADEYLFGYAYSTFSGFLLQQDFSISAIVGK